MQTFTSAKTSINANKLPAVSKLVNWEAYTGKTVMDYGGGKYDNLREWLLDTYDITLEVYDKYNRSEVENFRALSCSPSAIICSNVLNVIDCDETLWSIINEMLDYGKSLYIHVYEGNRSGIGIKTMDDSWQRNMKAKDYAEFFESFNYTIKGKLITVTF